MAKITIRTLPAILAASLMVHPGIARVRAQTRYQPSAANLAAREWFQNARFGLFVHWGVYSVLGDGEWVMNNRKIPIADYEKLPAQFNPVMFDPAEWVALAKAAGMKYITITSKHHDGFAMFDSKISDYDIDLGISNPLRYSRVRSRSAFLSSTKVSVLPSNTSARPARYEMLARCGSVDDR